MKKRKIVYLSGNMSSYEIKPKKPKSAVLIDSSTSFRRYNFGGKKIAVPKTGVELRK